jgi:hypothetical protein
VEATAGDAGGGSTLDGVAASVTADGGAISVSAAAANASVTANAGDARTGSTTDFVTGGAATVTGNGISVTKSAGASASVTAFGGTDNGSVTGRNLAGGAASIVSRASGSADDAEDPDEDDDAIVPGSITVKSTAGTTGTASVEARGGVGYGSQAGGDGTVEADAGITVTGTAGTPATSGAGVYAFGGEGTVSVDNGIGGTGTIEAGGKISVQAVSGYAVVQAQGGNSTGTTANSGAAGSGVIEGSEIEVSTAGAGVAHATVLASGGYKTNRLPDSTSVAGGDASVKTTDGGISVVSNGVGVGVASVQALASHGAGANGGGDAEVTSHGGITVTGTKGGGALVEALAGNSGTGGTVAAGGTGKVVASGAIDVQSFATAAAITASGGNNNVSATSESGLALVQGAGITVTGGTVAGKEASITVTGGAGSGAADAGAARLDSLSGDTRYDIGVESGTGAALIAVKAGDSANVGGVVGTEASILAKDLTIQAGGTGSATVEIEAGDLTPFAGGVGGNINVNLSGDLTILGKDSVGTGNGAAGLDATPGSGGVSGTDGHTLLDVGNDLTIRGGAGVNNVGGRASLSHFETVNVGNRLTVDSGRASDPYLGGGGYFSATNLKALAIDLTKSGTGTNFDFSADNLDVTGNDTTIDPTGTVLRAAPLDSDARFGNITVADHRLSILNEDGAVQIARLVVPAGEEATLHQESASNSAIGALVLSGATVTNVLPADFQDGDVFMEATTVDIKGATLYVDATQSGLGKGESFTLYKGTVDYDDDTTFVNDDFESTFATLYDLVADPDDPSGLTYIVRTVGAHPRLKALSEGVAAGQAFLNQGSDLVSGEGVTSAISAAADAGPSFFSAISYGSSRYETGSHVDVDGVSFLLGAALGTDVSVGRITVGAFFEIGDGSYDTYNDFSAYNNVEGSGDTKYVGGGLLARLDFAKSDAGATYVELSARAGRSSTDFRSEDFNRPVSYDIDSNYYGFHLGLGRVFNVTDATSLDLYGKWLFTRSSSNDVLAGGEVFHFDDVTSHRLRAGARISTAVNDMVRPYFGLAYEHEVDGKAGASVLGNPIDVPELKGGTGIGELGVSILPKDGLTLDIGIQGYAGVRQGISGSVRFVYNF